MNEMDALNSLRRDRGTLTEDGRQRGRLALQAAVRAERLGRRDRTASTGRRFAGLAAVGVAAAAGLVAVQLAVPGGGGAAQAAVTLDRAAATAAADAPLAPEPDQFVLARIVQRTDGDTLQRIETWVSADGKRQGRMTIDSGANAGDYPIAPYDPSSGLRNAPYEVVAALPTDPAALLERLKADPLVAVERERNGMSAEVGVWSLLRELLDDAPPAQKAALLQAAKLVPGITYVADSKDALGRPGEAVALTDPRLGEIQLVFDKRTHAFLGERLLTERGGPVQGGSAVEAVAVVDAVGAHPAG